MTINKTLVCCNVRKKASSRVEKKKISHNVKEYSRSGIKNWYWKTFRR